MLLLLRIIPNTTMYKCVFVRTSAHFRSAAVRLSRDLDCGHAGGPSVDGASLGPERPPYRVLWAFSIAISSK